MSAGRIGLQRIRRRGKQIAHRDDGTDFDRDPAATRRNQKKGTTEVDWRTAPTDPRGEPLGRWSAPVQNITTFFARSGKVCWLYRLSGLVR